VISQGKVVALDRWGVKWNHLSMTHRLTTNYAKNYCNRTLIVKVIVENVVTCFLGTRCSCYMQRSAAITNEQLFCYHVYWWNKSSFIKLLRQFHTGDSARFGNGDDEDLWTRVHQCRRRTWKTHWKLRDIRWRRQEIQPELVTLERVQTGLPGTLIGQTSAP